MSWLPFCLFLVLFTHNVKPESQFMNRLPRDVEQSSTEPSSTAPSSTEPSSTAPSSTEPSSTVPSSTEPSSTAPSSTEPSSTEPSSTAPSSTEPSSTAPSSTEPSSTAPSSTTTGALEENKKDGDECDANSLNNIVCENDRLKFCGPNNKIMSVQCVVKGKQGYCNCEKNGCVAQKPVCPGDKTKCYQPNTKLPDNLDCHKFTYCNENKEKLTLECSGNLIYDINEEKCLDRRSTRCHRVVCPRPGKSLQLLPFPQAKNYYVLCYNGIGDVRKCPDEYHGVRSNTCQFDCNLKNASGQFKDTKLELCKKGHYYVCKRSGSKYITIPNQCPMGMTFDDDLGFCTEEDNCTESESEKN